MSDHILRCFSGKIHCIFLSLIWYFPFLSHIKFNTDNSRLFRYIKIKLNLPLLLVILAPGNTRQGNPMLHSVCWYPSCYKSSAAIDILFPIHLKNKFQFFTGSPCFYADTDTLYQITESFCCFQCFQYSLICNISRNLGAVN